MSIFSDAELAFTIGVFVGVVGMFVAVSFMLAIEYVENWLGGKRAKRDRILRRLAGFDAEKRSR